MAAPVSTIDYLAHVDHYGVEVYDPYDPQRYEDTAAISQRIFHGEDDRDMIRQRHIDLAGHEAYRFQIWFDRPDDEPHDEPHEE
jgi:hypothetical protein